MAERSTGEPSRGEWPRSLSPRSLIPAGVAAWCVVVAGGFFWMSRFDTTPGALGEGAAIAAPDVGAAKRARPELVLTLHPRCSCSEATLEELERLMARYPEKVDVRILLVTPPGATADWKQNNALEAHAKRIPGATVRWDHGGREAIRLGARTSGEAFYFGADGQLLFHGGITGARGHVGDNDGLDSLASLMATGTTTQPQHPVFGCSLFDRS